MPPISNNSARGGKYLSVIIEGRHLYYFNEVIPLSSVISVSMIPERRSDAVRCSLLDDIEKTVLKVSLLKVVMFP